MGCCTLVVVRRCQSKETGLKTVLENDKFFNISALCAFSPMPDLFGITLIEVKYEFNIAMLDISPPPCILKLLLVYWPLSAYTA